MIQKLITFYTSVCSRYFPGRKIPGNRKKSRFKWEIPGFSREFSGFPAFLSLPVSREFFLPGNIETLFTPSSARFIR